MQGVGGEAGSHAAEGDEEVTQQEADTKELLAAPDLSRKLRSMSATDKEELAQWLADRAPEGAHVFNVHGETTTVEDMVEQLAGVLSDEGLDGYGGGAGGALLLFAVFVDPGGGN